MAYADAHPIALRLLITRLDYLFNLSFANKLITPNDLHAITGIDLKYIERRMRSGALPPDPDAPYIKVETGKGMIEEQRWMVRPRDAYNWFLALQPPDVVMAFERFLEIKDDLNLWDDAVDGLALVQ